MARTKRPKFDNIVYESDDMHVEYVERITKLGKDQGYETVRCPHCSKFLWTKGEVLPARL